MFYRPGARGLGSLSSFPKVGELATSVPVLAPDTPCWPHFASQLTHQQLEQQPPEPSPPSTGEDPQEAV